MEEVELEIKTRSTNLFEVSTDPDNQIVGNQESSFEGSPKTNQHRPRRPQFKHHPKMIGPKEEEAGGQD